MTQQRNTLQAILDTSLIAVTGIQGARCITHTIEDYFTGSPEALLSQLADQEDDSTRTDIAGHAIQTIFEACLPVYAGKDGHLWGIGLYCEHSDCQQELVPPYFTENSCITVEIKGIPTILRSILPGILIEANEKIAFIDRHLIYRDSNASDLLEAIREACVFGGYETWDRYYENNSNSHDLGKERLKVQYALERCVYLGMVDLFGLEAVEEFMNA